MIRRVLFSLGIITLVLALGFAGARSYFSDEERSTGNVLSAGAIDLLIDNHSWYYGPDAQGIVRIHERSDLTWEPTNLDGHLFFNFYDLKPGDWGEDTVSIRVDNNDAWACVDLYITRNDDMSSTEPELDAGDAQENPQDIWDGELAQELNFFFWIDDGDNVFEGENDHERILISGPASAALTGLHYTLVDSKVNNVGLQEGPLVGGQTYYIGKFWCYGDASPLTLSNESSNPGQRGTSGFECSGAQVGNKSQTDEVMADIAFYAVQARHNNDFVCGTQYTPGKNARLRLENKDSQWNPIWDGRYGILDFASASPTFDYSLRVYGLNPSTAYKLIYYKDPWPGTGSKEIASFTTDGAGNWSGSGSVELNTDLPTAGDPNSGAKIWVVLSSDWDSANQKMKDWHQSEYLFEWNLISYDDTDV